LYFSVQAASSNTNYVVLVNVPYARTLSTGTCKVSSGTSSVVTVSQCGPTWVGSPGKCGQVFSATTCATTNTAMTLATGAGAVTGGNDLRLDFGTVTGTVNDTTITIY
jgi:hypothetical protein